MSRTFPPLEERFWAKVEKRGPDDCWEWTGSRHPWGYGQIISTRANRPQRAHRVSWELANGPIPAGLWVLHRCDNPPCVNPAHLFLGTAKDNWDDATRKGRGQAAKNAAKTHCKHGHPFDEKNTCYFNGQRGCKTCRKQYGKRANGKIPAVAGS